MGRGEWTVHPAVQFSFRSGIRRRLADEHIFRQLLHRSVHTRLQIIHGQTHQVLPGTYSE